MVNPGVPPLASATNVTVSPAHGRGPGQCDGVGTAMVTSCAEQPEASETVQE
jgi:hypothetical protein